MSDVVAWIRALPPDAITQVVRAYEDAEMDDGDCAAAFRDALLSLAPKEEKLCPTCGGPMFASAWGMFCPDCSGGASAIPAPSGLTPIQELAQAAQDYLHSQEMVGHTEESRRRLHYHLGCLIGPHLVAYSARGVPPETP